MFSWVTRAMGPWAGWIGGWAITMTGVLVIGSLADVGIRFTLYMFGADSLGDNAWVRMPLAVVLILLMTWLCVLGTDVSARIQNTLIFGQVGRAPGVRRGRHLQGVCGDQLPRGDPARPRLAQPVRGGWRRLVQRAAARRVRLLGVGVLREPERGDPRRRQRAGPRGGWATFILLITYVSVAFAVVAFAGTQWLSDNAGEEEFVFAYIASEVLGGWDWVLLFAVATSAIASTQTTIIPASRTGLSMARRHALPHTFVADPPYASDSGRQHVVGRRYRHRLVRRYLPGQRERALRLTHRAVVADRLRTTRSPASPAPIFYRRHLTESVEELPADRRRSPRRLRAAGLAAVAVDPRHVRPRELVQRAVLARCGPATRDRRRHLPRRHRRDADLADAGLPVLAGTGRRRRSRHRARPQGRCRRSGRPGGRTTWLWCWGTTSRRARGGAGYGHPGRGERGREPDHRLRGGTSGRPRRGAQGPSRRADGDGQHALDGAVERAGSRASRHQTRLVDAEPARRCSRSPTRSMRQ